MYARLSEATARQTRHRPTLSYVLMAIGVYRLGVGRWEQVQRDAEESIAIAEQLGDQHQLGLSLTLEAMRQCFVGEFRAAEPLYDRIAQIGRAADNDLHEAWGYSGRGECLFRLGRFADAAASLQNAIALLADKEHRTEEIRLSGMLAATHLRLSDAVSAEQHARRTMRLIADASYTTVSTLEGFSGAAEVLLARWREHPGDPARRSEAERACAQLSWYSKVFPIGWPRWYDHFGTCNWLLGRRRQALRCWRASLREATRLGMPLEIATAHLRLGTADDSSSPARAEQLREALRIFEELGAAHEARLARSALDEPGRSRLPGGT
jgi:tetratricopeptide (TPR) repeat protein